MKTDRRGFLKVGGMLGAGALMGASGSPVSEKDIYIPRFENKKSIFNMCGYCAPKIDHVRIGFIGVGGRGQGAVYRMSRIENVTIKALCDVQKSKLNYAMRHLQDYKKTPDFYTGENDWKAVCEREDIDLIYIASHWALHAPAAIYAMKQGKHVCVEIPAAVTVEEAWELVETSEETKRHCMMLENCCYDFFELLTLSMAQQGFLGEIVHGDAAYIHDLLNGLASKGMWNMWRLKENYERKGNLYPTHGLGPVCQMMNVNRGDKLEHLVSMSSADFMLGQRIKDLAEKDSFYKGYAEKEYRGNMNTSIIKTYHGKTIMLQHDVTSPRPYTRHHVVSGTKGTVQKWPLPGRISTNHKGWYSTEGMKQLTQRFEPPIVKKVGELAKQIGGHGGMDFIMDWRTIDCLRNGLPFDQDVYDAALWSCILPVSEASVNNKSRTMDIPDFTRGRWKENKPVDLSMKEGGNTKVKK